MGKLYVHFPHRGSIWLRPARPCCGYVDSISIVVKANVVEALLRLQLWFLGNDCSVPTPAAAFVSVLVLSASNKPKIAHQTRFPYLGACKHSCNMFLSSCGTFSAQIPQSHKHLHRYFLCVKVHRQQREVRCAMLMGMDEDAPSCISYMVLGSFGFCGVSLPSAKGAL